MGDYHCRYDEYERVRCNERRLNFTTEKLDCGDGCENIKPKLIPGKKDYMLVFFF